MTSTTGQTATQIAAHPPRAGSLQTPRVADLAWPDVQRCLEEGCGTAVVPIGSCEQHGPHLPMGMDTYTVYEAATRGVRLAREQAGAPVALLFPLLWYSDGQQWAPGEVWLRPTTIIAVLGDIIAQLEAQGFRRIVLVTGHGGNTGVMGEALQEARARGARAELFAVHAGAFQGEARRAVQESRKTGHACEIETSVGLYLVGDRVRTERITPGPEQPTYWQEISPYEAVRRGDVRQQGVSIGRLGQGAGRHPGYVGDPTKASAAKGERIVGAYAAGLAAFLGELHADAPHSTGGV